jgi:hypothetical protein
MSPAALRLILLPLSPLRWRGSELVPPEPFVRLLEEAEVRVEIVALA